MGILIQKSCTPILIEKIILYGICSFRLFSFDVIILVENF